MNIRELSAEPREAIGKAAVGRLRRKGLVPAILYGAGNAPLPLAVAPTEVQRALRAHAAGGVLVGLRLPGETEARPAVVRDLQFDPVRDSLIHIDFQAVRMDEEITVETIRTRNLILFGDPETNRVLRRIHARLPVRWRRDGVVAEIVAGLQAVRG